MFEWVFASWPQLFDDLKNNKIDALLSTQVTDERKDFINFLSTPLYTMCSELYIHKTNQFNNLTDLNGKSIGLVKDDNNAIGFEQYIEGFHLTFNKVYFNSHQEAFLALLDGRLYAVVGPSPTFLKLPWEGLKSSGLYFNPTTSISVFKNPIPIYGRLLIKGLPFIKKTLTHYLTNYSCNINCRNTWLPARYCRQWLKMAFISLILFAIAVVIFVIVLRKQVQLKTLKKTPRTKFARNA
jgi:hypothetical protein